MIEYFLVFLENLFHLSFPKAFFYVSTRMMCAAMTALLLTVFMGPWLIRKLRKWNIGETICEDLGDLHGAKAKTPTMGGALVLFSMLISLFLWMDPSSIFTWILAVTTLFLGALGAIDDYVKLKNSKGISAKKKIVVQGVLASLIAVYLLFPGVLDFGVRSPKVVEWVSEEKTPKNLSLHQVAKRLYVPFFKTPLFVFSTGLAFLFVLFVIIGSSNAVNLTDGLDGLATGCMVFAALSLAIVAFLSNHMGIAKYLNLLYIEGSGEIAVYLSAFVGASLGFLWFNGHPAEVFLGDTGSLSLGGILGVCAVLLKRELLLGIVGGIFVIEAISVILQVGSYKLRGKKRIFLCAPLHHHFEYKGWPESKVVLRFWIICFLLSVIGLSSLKFQ